MFGFIEDICKNVGPRESGSEEEIKAGNKIEKELKKFCDDVVQEEYIASPKAFLGGIRYGAFLVVVAICLYWFSLLIDLNIIKFSRMVSLVLLGTSFLLTILTVSYFILEVMRYYEAFDFLFPKKKSKNVIGTINPRKEIKRDLIFSAHHDSAYEFNLFYRLKRFGQLTINIGYIGVAFFLMVVAVRLILNIFFIYFEILFFIFGVFFIALIPIAILYMFFHSYRSVLGAFDNLSGVAIILGIGKFLSENKSNPEIFPNHTRIRLISFAGEEAGLRGAKRYLSRHYDELSKNNTIIVNMDSISKKDDLIILTKEPLIGAKHDPHIYNSLFNIANELDLNVKLSSLAFGATDAAAFSKKNISATTLSDLNLEEELVPFYHTRNDTPDVIDKEALGQIVKLCMKYLKQIDV
jgi:hypothetical protein